MTKKREGKVLQFHQVELLLLGQYVFDVGLKFGVFLDDLAADGALGAGFYL